jgi:hypothetical protein
MKFILVKRKNLIIYCISIVLVVLIILIFQGRYTHKKINYAALNAVCFEKDVLPFFKRNCSVAGCHDQQTGSGSYIFVDYNSIIKSVVPFEPEKSIVYKSILGNGVSKMPPGLELDENEIQLINIWIGQGAGNTVCYLPGISLKIQTAGSIFSQRF